jgi:hypothetical protein
LALRCFQCLSFPDIATQLTHLAARLEHQRSVIPGPLVLGNDPFKFPTPTADRDRTVSRRSEPSSRTTLTGEQTDPWELLHPQDVMSRHRTLFHAFAWRRLYLHPSHWRDGVGVLWQIDHAIQGCSNLKSLQGQTGNLYRNIDKR